jgi:putative chitinase
MTRASPPSHSGRTRSRRLATRSSATSTSVQHDAEADHRACRLPKIEIGCFIETNGTITASKFFGDGGRRMPDLNAPILTGLLLYGIFGAAGQIIRAVVALGGSQTLTNAGANQQSLFNAAYFVVTLIIGFVAGLLAGLVALKTIAQPWGTETALAAMAAGYAGADFIENTYSALGAAFGVGGGTGQGQGPQPRAQPAQPPAQPTVQFVAPAIVPTESASRLGDVETRVSALEAVVAPVPLSVLASPGNSAAEVTVDMVCKMFPATPKAPIVSNLPFVLDGLQWRGLTDKEMVCVALATIRAETEGFIPISEYVSSLNSTTKTNPFDLYDPGTKIGEALGNTQPGDGARFCGRGFVQLTGRSNYTRIGNETHINLSASPGLANDPATAGKILAQFLYDHQNAIRTALGQNNLAAARKAVNGGSNGLLRFETAYRTGQDVIPA